MRPAESVGLAAIYTAGFTASLATLINERLLLDLLESFISAADNTSLSLVFPSIYVQFVWPAPWLKTTRFKSLQNAG